MNLLAVTAALCSMALGIAGIILKRNLIMKLLSLNIVDTSSILFFLGISHTGKSQAPIVVRGVSNYADPLPQALVSSVIIINFGILALSLIFTMVIVKRYHTLDVKRIEREAQYDYSQEESE